MKNQNKRSKSFELLKTQAKDMPVFVLVRPQKAENIGMAARAMMNCGIYDLRIVSPRESHLSEAALSACSGADVILKNASIFDCLEDAIADMKLVLATTARKRFLNKRVILPPQMAEFFSLQDLSLSQIAVLFGCERTGLENSELMLSDYLLTIPLNPEHSSLNLSQAVLLVAYSFLSLDNTFPFLPSEEQRATKAEVSAFLKKMNIALEKKGYYWMPDKKEGMEQNLNNIFLKADLTTQEVKTLHGAINFLLKENKKIT